MKNMLLLIVFLLEAALAPAQQSGFPDFNVAFPKRKCDVQKQENKIPLAGEVTVTSWLMHRKEAENAFLYMVSSTPVPEALAVFLTMDTKTLNLTLQTLLQGAASEFGGTDFIFSEFSHNGYEGLETTCKIENDGGELKGRIFKSGNMIYVICGGGKPINLPETDKFLNSFQLKK